MSLELSDSEWDVLFTRRYVHFKKFLKDLFLKKSRKINPVEFEMLVYLSIDLSI